MNKNNSVIGHGLAMITIIIWGTTFIATKVLLREFAPVEILCYRFLIGFAVLMIAYPHRMKVEVRKHEWLFAGAGLTGITLYFLLENIALTYSMVSNVGVILSVAPFFTAILAHLFLKSESLNKNFFIGFVVSITGVFLISVNSSEVLKMNPLGDILALLAAIVWAVYSILTKKILTHGYATIPSTRRIFLYGLLFMTPALYFMDFHWGINRFIKPLNLANILFLGVAASAICFATWNLAVKLLGAVKTSVYIYIVPIVSIVTARIILKEQITPVALIGTVFTLLGLIISGSKKEFGWKKKVENQQVVE